MKIAFLFGMAICFFSFAVDTPVTTDVKPNSAVSVNNPFSSTDSPSVKDQLDQESKSGSENDIANLKEYSLNWLNKIETVKVGDKLKFEVNDLKYDENTFYEVELPKGSSSLAKLGWNIYVPGNTEAESGFRFNAIAIGKVETGLPSFLIKNSQGELIGRTEAFPVIVHSAIDPNDPNARQTVPPRPTEELNLPIAMMLILGVLACFVIALIIVGLVIWSRKRRKIGNASPLEPIIPPKQKAFRALNELSRKDLSKSKEFKSLYFGVSEILKKYLDENYGLPVEESTTSEMFKMLEAVPFELAKRDELIQIFRELDEVKFTDIFPEQENSDSLINRTKEWINSTHVEELAEEGVDAL